MNKIDLEKRLRGWFPKEPLPKTCTATNLGMAESKAVLDKKMRKAGMIANSVSYMAFGGFYFLVAQPFYHYDVSLEVTALTWIFFAVTVAALNLAIYRHYKQRMPKGGL